MDAIVINRWIDGLGRTCDQVINERIIPDQPL